jgi:hypothetical protein
MKVTPSSLHGVVPWHPDQADSTHRLLCEAEWSVTLGRIDDPDQLPVGEVPIEVLQNRPTGAAAQLPAIL